MSKTNLPGFTGEASLYSASNHYYVHGMYHRTEQKIYPADYIDQNCLADCLQDCGIVCAGTSGQGKAYCVRRCEQDNAACASGCTRPGSPPGGGGGGNPCAPGTPCNGGCCPPGLPSCNAGLSWCCPALFPTAISVFGIIICV